MRKNPGRLQGLVHARVGLVELEYDLTRDAANIGVLQGDGGVVIALAHLRFHAGHIARAPQAHDALSAVGQVDLELVSP